MKEYRVGYWYSEYGSVVIEAETPEQAEKKLSALIEKHGIEAIDTMCTGVDIHTTESGVQDAEEVKK